MKYFLFFIYIINPLYGNTLTYINEINEIQYIKNKNNIFLHNNGIFTYIEKKEKKADGIVYIDSKTMNGQWIRNFHNCVNLKWFGFSEENNASVNSQSFQKAINNHQCIKIPFGKYKINKVNLKEGTRIIGSGKSINGKYGTVLISQDKITFNIEGKWKIFNSRRDIEIKNLTVINNQSYSITLKADFLTRFSLRNLYFKGKAKYHLYLENCYNGTIRDSSFIGATTANVYFSTKKDKQDNVFSGQTLWENCDFWDSKGFGFLLKTPYNINEQNIFIKSHFKKNTIGFKQKKGGITTFIASHFEESKKYDVYTINGYNPSIISCFFNNNRTYQAGIKFNGSLGLISNTRFIGYTNGSIPIILNGQFTKIDTVSFRLQRNGKVKNVILLNGKNNVIDNFLFLNNHEINIDNVIYEKYQSTNKIKQIHIKQRRGFDERNK